MNTTLARTRRHGPSILLVLAGVLLAFPNWATPGQPALDDLSHLNAPQRMFLAWAYQHLQVPLWNPFSFAGQPFLAAGQSGPLYLPNVIYLLLPVAKALTISTVMHAALCAVGMYALAYDLTRRRLPSVAGALCFAACGFFVGHQVHTQMFDTLAFLPLVTLSQRRLWNRPTAVHVVALATVLALEVYAGHPQMVFYTAIVLLIDAAFHLRPYRRQVWLAWLGALTLAALLSAPQWANTLDLMLYSDRAHAGASFLLQGSLSPWAFLQWIAPDTAGGGWSGSHFSAMAFERMFGLQFWESWCTIGLVGFLFALAAACAGWRQGMDVPEWTVGAVVTSLLALGGNGPFFWALTHLPGFDLFRVPARYIGLTDFYLSLLCAVGLRLWQSPAHRPWFGRAVRYVCLVCASALIASRLAGPLSQAPVLSVLTPLATVLAIAGVASLTAPLARTASLAAAASAVLHASLTATIVNAKAAPYTSPSPIVTWLAHHTSSSVGFPRIVSLGETDVELDEGLSRRLPMVNGYDSLEPAWYSNHVGLTWTDTVFLNQPRALADSLGVRYIVAASGYTPFQTEKPGHPTQWSGVLPALPPGTKSLAIQLRRPPYAPSYAWIEQTWLSVTVTAAGRSKTYWIRGLPASEYLIDLPRDWPRTVQTKVSVVNQSWNANVPLGSLVVLGSGRAPVRENVGVTLSPQPWTPVFSAHGQTIWKNPDPVAPAWFARRPEWYPGWQAETAHRVKWGLNRQVWQVDAPSSGWFVLSQMFDPNWHATVDGRSASIKRVDGVLTAVKVGPGRHRIVLTYRPLMWRPSLASAAAGLLISGLSIGVASARKRP
ncbi:YfhO family protein [Alicyclobacillus kakegawensis]|uniref:YfhO family protein n=1 Tax=Alicyclobacillus kakegawensis TaxID=392012 RepID=UPI00082DE613|nr:YfhO family protein [Alicyclobacillus kakegawensis]